MPRSPATDANPLNQPQPRVWALAIAHALLFVSALPPFDAWFFAFLAPVPLAWLAITALSARRAVLITFLTQWVMWLWLLRWIMPVTKVGYPFLALYQSIFACLFLWFVRRVSRHPIVGRWPMMIVLPIVWTSIELFRGQIAFNGYPWYLLAHPAIAWLAFVQSADLFGTYLISFVITMVSGFIVDIIRMSREARGVLPHRIAVQALSLAFVIGANVAYGSWRMRQTACITAGPRILAIQTNLPQDNKIGWSREQQAIDIPEFIALTRRALEQSGEKPDMIIWPETMVPGLGFEPQTIEHIKLLGPDASHLNRWPLEIEALSRELAIPMLVGSIAWTDTKFVPLEDTRVRLDPGREYNSAYLIEGQPPYQRYDKCVLTPFGETMPYISNWKWLEQKMLAFGAPGMSFNLDSNPDIRILKLTNNHSRDGTSSATVRLGTPICFEDTVAWYCRRMVYDGGVKRADVLVNVSNDGWFNTSISDRKLHAQIARFRCIENRVPMVRCVNTGLSVSIDSAGRLIGAALGEGYGNAQGEGWLSANTQLDSRSTLYGRIGELWPWVCFVATLALFGWTFVNRTKGEAR